MVVAEGEVFGVFAEGVDDDGFSGVTEGIGDGSEGISIDHEEGGVFCRGGGGRRG